MCKNELTGNLPTKQRYHMGASHPDLFAIDVLLLPDRATIAKSISLNAQLRANYPAGYALDATRIPHLTLVQRFVAAGFPWVKRTS